MPLSLMQHFAFLIKGRRCYTADHLNPEASATTEKTRDCCFSICININRQWTKIGLSYELTALLFKKF